MLRYKSKVAILFINADTDIGIDVINTWIQHWY